MSRALIEALAALPPKDAETYASRIGFSRLRHYWPLWALPGQYPPASDWRVWLLMAGRGYGKTRAGAEWVRSFAETTPAARIALVGATLGEAQRIMIDGPSGLRAIAPRTARPHWEASRNRLVWPNGAQAEIFSGENPDGLRGPQHHIAWCDELAKWAHPTATWNNLQMGLRLGAAPRAMVTTTPRSIALLRALRDAPDVVVTHGRTSDNPHLPDAFIAAVSSSFAGTRFGRQELDGEWLEDVDGALWPRALIEQCRAPVSAPIMRTVVAVDPPAGVDGDACGIIVAGLLQPGPETAPLRAIIMADASVQGLHPEGWGQAVARAAAHYGADRIIAEANQGGAMVASVLRAAGVQLPVRLIHATRGKVARAEPLAALYAAGRVTHAHAFPALEDELCGLQMGGGYVGPTRSPDRADALVYALTELLLGSPTGPVRVRRV